MWIKLALHYRAGQTSRVVGNRRGHEAEGRGTMRVMRNDKFLALVFIQAKKNAALLRHHGIAVYFDRAAAPQSALVSTRILLQRSSRFTPRILAYNVGLPLRSRPLQNGHRVLQALARWLEAGSVRIASRFLSALQKGGLDRRRLPRQG